MKVELVARTVEKQQYPDEFIPENVNKDIKIIAGKAAGICYAPDDYLSEGIQNSEKALRRASFNAKSGHYSVYEHAHLTFTVECTKAMAMVLNSTRLYSTSEKSARYTKMHPETEFERDFYGKWMGIFSNLIKVYNPRLDDNDIEKLAMENARYLTSVFTPTFMEFTVPSDRAILLIGWLKELADDIIRAKSVFIRCGGGSKIFDIYYDRIAVEASKLADMFKEAIGESDTPTLRDHKNIGIKFFDTISFLNHIGDSTDNNIEADSVVEVVVNNNSFISKEYYGDVYKSQYKASFASVAQIQRHRTTQVSIALGNANNVYVPKIIKGTPYEEEWIADYNVLVNHDVCPQAMLLGVEEKGLFSDFVLKCKERLCARAQLETSEVTRDQVTKFNIYEDNLDYLNNEALHNMLDDDDKVMVRCRFKGYTCNEPCNRVKSNYTRNI